MNIKLRIPRSTTAPPITSNIRVGPAVPASGKVGLGVRVNVPVGLTVFVGLGV